MDKLSDKAMEILIWLIIVGILAWPLANAYLEIRMKWNLSHIKNCPCIEQVKGE